MYLTYFFISKSLEVWNSVHALQWWNMEFHLHLGCVCFEWKWFLEILFRKCGCLVVHEKYIFRKCFLVWPCVGCKMIFVFILLSNIIFRKTERERERMRVRSRPCAKREREREPITGDPRASTSPVTQRLRATNPQTNLQLCWRTQSPDHATNPEPSTQS